MQHIVDLQNIKAKELDVKRRFQKMPKFSRNQETYILNVQSIILMYRAIPEANRICAMADRGRRYRLHQEALQKIKNKPNKNRSKSQMNGKPQRPYSLKGKVQKEEKERINHENQKMVKAIIEQEPTISRSDFIEQEMDHQHQVARMSQFDKANKHDKSQSKVTTTKNGLPDLANQIADTLADDKHSEDSVSLSN